MSSTVMPKSPTNFSMNRRSKVRRDPLIIRAKDLCVAVREFGKAGKLDLAASRRLDELQLGLVQGMAKLGDALHGVIEGNERAIPRFWLRC
jgi:hypothetical protein